MKYIARRGLSAKATEHTLSAFKLAAEMPHYHGIECDIHTTKDHHFVVFHDQNLKRLAKADIQIMESTYEELATYTLKSRPDDTIPLLQDFLKICSDADKTAVIEIKHIHDISLLSNLIDLLDTYPALPKILISYNRNYLKYIRAVSNIPLQLLLEKPSEEAIYDARVNQMDISLSKEAVNERIVKRLKKEGFQIGVFTVDNKRQARQFEKLGIDYLTTNKL